MKSCICLTIHGRVQGVYFRHHTREKALELGLVGFVKNQVDGTVYARGEGETSAVKKWVRWCHEGPVAARVDRVEISEKNLEKDPEGFTEFEIRQ
jgi:acylphosphatase